MRLDVRLWLKINSRFIVYSVQCSENRTSSEIEYVVRLLRDLLVHYKSEKARDLWGSPCVKSVSSSDIYYLLNNTWIKWHLKLKKIYYCRHWGWRRAKETAANTPLHILLIRKLCYEILNYATIAQKGSKVILNYQILSEISKNQIFWFFAIGYVTHSVM
jgi:hypothetical protein